MPVAALLYHNELKTVCQKREHNVLFALKLICYAAYYILVLLGLFLKEELWDMFNVGAMIFVGSFTILYSYAIFNIKVFSKSLSPD